MGDTVKCPCRVWENTRDAMGGRILRYRHADGHYSIIPLDGDDEPVHCYFCGARFALTDGTVAVSKSVAELEADLATEREAVEKLASSIVFETRHMDPEPCAHGRDVWDQPIDCPAPSSFDPPCAACWAEWARMQEVRDGD